MNSPCICFLPTDVKTLYETLSEKLIAQGVPETVVDALKERAIAELEERRCMVWNCASAIAPEQSSSQL